MQHRVFRTLSSSLLIALGAVLATGTISGCGGSATSGGSGKPSSAILESAKKSLATPTKLRGKKSLAPETNLSARERRALKQDAQTPK